jgi:signal transduction histidine kinase
MLTLAGHLFKNKFAGLLERMLPHKPASPNALPPSQIALSFLAGVIAGADKLTRVAHLRCDPLLPEIVQVKRVTDMIEQLLALAGAKGNRAALARKPLALADVLKDAIAASEHDTQTAGCVVQCEVPATLPLVSGDAPALRRVFQNLITNAAKHGGDGKWVGVTAAVVNGENAPAVEVRVADRGAGISESEQAEIFKPFTRGAVAKASQIRGSGLGLSLVREIVKLHQGSVCVNSKPGRGATFIVRLPVFTGHNK